MRRRDFLVTGISASGLFLAKPLVEMAQSVVRRPIVSAAGPAGTPFILGQTLGTLRNDFTGCVGFIFTVGASPIDISALGRWVVAGNSGTHVVYVTDGSTNVVASASVNTSGAATGAYKYVSITPVTLTNGFTYAVYSAETNTGDQWYSDDTAITSVTAAHGTLLGAQGNTAVPPSSPNDFPGAVGQFSYTPVNFLTTP